MKTYRTVKPILVQAVQVAEPMQIKSSKGMVEAHKGDWLVLGPHGEYYKCDSAEFANTFETVDVPFVFAEASSKECGC